MFNYVPISNRFRSGSPRRRIMCGGSDTTATLNFLPRSTIVAPWTLTGADIFRGCLRWTEQWHQIPKPVSSLPAVEITTDPSSRNRSAAMVTQYNRPSR